MIDISAHGVSITVIATSSFPVGFTIKELADDIDPLSFEETEPFGYEMLYDGDMFAFDKANVVKVSVGVIAGSDADINLKILLQSKKGSKSILPIPDVTTMVVNYPHGTVILTKGTLLSGPLADSISTNARKKGNKYTFVFSAFAGAQNTKDLIATVARNILSVI